MLIPGLIPALQFPTLLSDSYSHLSGRPVRKKTEEEEKLLKLLQGIPRPQDGFTQWCEQMLHTLSTTGSLDGRAWHTHSQTCCGAGLLVWPGVLDGTTISHSAHGCCHPQGSGVPL